MRNAITRTRRPRRRPIGAGGCQPPEQMPFSRQTCISMRLGILQLNPTSQSVFGFASMPPDWRAPCRHTASSPQRRVMVFPAAAAHTAFLPPAALIGPAVPEGRLSGGSSLDRGGCAAKSLGRAPSISHRLGCSETGGVNAVEARCTVNGGLRSAGLYRRLLVAAGLSGFGHATRRAETAKYREPHQATGSWSPQLIPVAPKPRPRSQGTPSTLNRRQLLVWHVVLPFRRTMTLAPSRIVPATRETEPGTAIPGVRTHPTPCTLLKRRR